MVFEQIVKSKTENISVGQVMELYHRSKIRPYEGQRTKWVWDVNRQRFVIDSTLTGIYIPPILVTVQDGILEVIDGLQRIEALYAFYTNKLYIEIGKPITFRELSQDEADQFLLRNIPIVYIEGSRKAITEQLIRINDGVSMNAIEKRNAESTDLARYVRSTVEKYGSTLQVFSNVPTTNKRMFLNDMLERLILMYESGLTKSLTPKTLKDLHARHSSVSGKLVGNITQFLYELSSHIGEVIVKKQNVLTLASVLIEANNRGLTLKSKTLMDDLLKAEKQLIQNDPEYAQYSQQGGYGKSVIQMRARKLLKILK